MKHRTATTASFLFALLVPGIAAAAEPAAAAAGEPLSGSVYAIAVAFGIALAAFGGALGQGRAASAALDGICRNPSAADKVFTPMLLSLAFIESLVIFTFVSAFIIR